MLIITTTGRLVADPVSRQTKTGRPYATAIISAETSDNKSTLVSCIAFSQTAAVKLLERCQGDIVAVTGSGRLTSWTKDGAEHHGLSVTVDRLLTPAELSKYIGMLREPAIEKEPA